MEKGASLGKRPLPPLILRTGCQKFHYCPFQGVQRWWHGPWGWDCHEERGRLLLRRVGLRREQKQRLKSFRSTQPSPLWGLLGLQPLRGAWLFSWGLWWPPQVLLWSSSSRNLFCTCQKCRSYRAQSWYCRRTQWAGPCRDPGREAPGRRQWARLGQGCWFHPPGCQPPGCLGGQEELQRERRLIFMALQEGFWVYALDHFWGPILCQALLYQLPVAAVMLHNEQPQNLSDKQQ